MNVNPNGNDDYSATDAADPVAVCPDPECESKIYDPSDSCLKTGKCPYCETTLEVVA